MPGRRPLNNAKVPIIAQLMDIVTTADLERLYYVQTFFFLIIVLTSIVPSRALSGYLAKLFFFFPPKYIEHFNIFQEV